MQPVVLPSAQPGARAVVQPTVQRSLQAGKESPVLSLPKDGNLQPVGAASNHFLLLLGGKELHHGRPVLQMTPSDAVTSPWCISSERTDDAVRSGVTREHVLRLPRLRRPRQLRAQRRRWHGGNGLRAARRRTEDSLVRRLRRGLRGGASRADRRAGPRHARARHGGRVAQAPPVRWRGRRSRRRGRFRPRA